MWERKQKEGRDQLSFFYFLFFSVFILQASSSSSCCCESTKTPTKRESKSARIEEWQGKKKQLQGRDLDKDKTKKVQASANTGKKDPGRETGGRGTPIFLPYSLSINTCSLHGLLLFPALAKAQRCLIDAHLSADQ